METQSRLIEPQEFSWHNYNLSQTKEKALFVNILGDLCNLVVEPQHNKGRKPRPMKDIVFALVMKEYLNTSSRRVQSDLRLFAEAGFINSEIPFNTLLDHLERRELKDVLRELIELSSMPLKQIEKDFAIDATCFGTSRYTTYFDVRWGKNKDRQERVWRKCHAVCGIATNIITSIEITKGYVHDATQFEQLAKDTNRNFKINYFIGDKGYQSIKNINVIRDLGGTAIIPFKKNQTGKGRRQGDSFTYKQLFNFFQKHREDFMKIYHRRSNIESCFSMIKRKFGNNVKCKKETSQDNEILARVLAHNICVLVQELFLNQIDINFNKCSNEYVGK